MLFILVDWNNLCSGHGTVINSGDCVCDSGYNGQYCDQIENVMGKLDILIIFSIKGSCSVVSCNLY